jgi:hypothetical protein
MKRPLLTLCLVVCGLIAALPAAAFTNNRYLAYGHKPQTTKSEILGDYTVGNAYINSLIDGEINKLLAEGLLKGQKGDKGDPGQPGENALNSLVPQDGVLAPAPIVYNSNIPGTIAGFTELSGGDIVAQTSLTVDSGAPAEISAGSNLEVDGNANFTASTTMADLNVPTIESPSGAYLSSGGDWVNASSRDLKTNLATVSPQTVLSEIDSLPIYTWNYKTQTASSTHMGPMAQDFYSDFGLGDSSSSISTIDPSGVALAGIQGLDAKFSSLLDISWILDSLKSLGLSVSQDLVIVKNFIADSITTNSLEVGSSGQPTGITIYDRATGQPVCVYSENNVLQSAPGKCDSGLISQTSAMAPVDATPQDPSDATTTPVLDPAAQAVGTSTQLTEEQNDSSSDGILVNSNSNSSSTSTSTPAPGNN